MPTIAELKAAVGELFQLLGYEDPAEIANGPVDYRLRQLLPLLGNRARGVFWKKGVSSPEDRDELVADVYLRILRMDPNQVRSVRDPWSYFNQICLNVCNDHLSRIIKERQARGDFPQEAVRGEVSETSADEGFRPDELAIGSQMVEALQTALSANDFELLTKVSLGYTPKELAAWWHGIPLDQVPDRSEANMRQRISALRTRTNGILSRLGFF